MGSSKGSEMTAYVPERWDGVIRARPQIARAFWTIIAPRPVLASRTLFRSATFVLGVAICQEMEDVGGFVASAVP